MPYKLAIRDIKPNPDNPREITKSKLEELKQSLREDPDMLRVRPIVINQDFVILGGNMRYEAAKAIGMHEVWVERVQWDEPAQKRFVLKDNVSSGKWDWDALANGWEIPELEAAGISHEWMPKSEEEKETCPECGRPM